MTGGGPSTSLRPTPAHPWAPSALAHPVRRYARDDKEGLGGEGSRDGLDRAGECGARVPQATVRADVHRVDLAPGGFAWTDEIDVGTVRFIARDDRAVVV